MCVSVEFYLLFYVLNSKRVIYCDGIKWLISLYMISRCILDNDPRVVNSSDDALVSALMYRNDHLASFLIEKRKHKARYIVLE